MDRLIAVIEFLRLVMDRYHVPRLDTVRGALGLRGTRVQGIADLSSTAKRDRVRLKEETRTGFPFFAGERRCSEARTAPVKVHVAGIRAGPVCIGLVEVRFLSGDIRDTRRHFLSFADQWLFKIASYFSSSIRGTRRENLWPVSRCTVWAEFNGALRKFHPKIEHY